MGDPKKFRKKFTKPRHPWQRQRLETEKELVAEYGIKNKKELWKIVSQLNNFANQAKILTPKLQSHKKEQAEKEQELFLVKLCKLGLLKKGDGLGEVLNLTTRDLLERRLQTILLKKGFARSVKQARQFITHGHVMIDNKKVTSPSYLIKINEESLISFSDNSALNDANHPERAQVVSKKVETKVETKAKTEKKEPVKKEASEKKADDKKQDKKE
jgi:small subunit ribosomal protein S4